ncbi:UrcA family protein [Hyphomonas johnsonii]|jgi:UrcA family protein|uniref:UrcA family protein n=1 Tax=Hyphomonas johnsonii MHS-2 TaxID=1280950 RepID=A0A059FQX3_9PROT|nr:UrcA family protein [Hyphomonas johnsonii]KCZ92936.1 hypothetical protein HJO_08272 [Hyphomonas johnsonii MHS-2]
MLKPTATILAVAIALCPVAIADQRSKPVTVSIAYDKALLETDSGARQVLALIKAKATQACTSYVPVLGGNHTDDKCVADIQTAAIAKIHDRQVREGLATADVFASKAVMILADSGQR